MKTLLKKYNKQFTGVVASLFITPVLFATVYDNSKVASVASKTQQHADQNPFQTQSVFDSGVIGIGAYNDDKRATFAGTFASYLGDQHRHAIALELNGGPDLFRLNATYGVALTDHQRIKLTAERLNQRMDFNYVTGNASHWDGQNALGAEYAYLLENKWIESVGLGGYFSHSGSKDLSDKSFEDANGQKWVEHRRIAGADTFNLHTNTAFHLWSHSRLTAGVDYDSVKFNTKYNGQGKNVRGFGGHAQLEQRVLPQLKLMADTHVQSNEHGYGGGIGWLLPTSVPMELQATTNYTNSLVTHRHYFTSGLHLNVALGNSESHQGYKPEYVDLDGNHAQSLLDWTRVPAVRMSEVVATTDSRLQNVTPKFKKDPSEESSSEDDKQKFDFKDMPKQNLLPMNIVDEAMNECKDDDKNESCQKAKKKLLVNYGINLSDLSYNDYQAVRKKCQAGATKSACMDLLSNGIQVPDEWLENFGNTSPKSPTVPQKQENTNVPQQDEVHQYVDEEGITHFESGDTHLQFGTPNSWTQPIVDIDSGESDKTALDEANSVKQKEVDLDAEQEKLHGQGHGYGHTKK